MLDRTEFEREWTASGKEDTSLVTVDTAWRRYGQVVQAFGESSPTQPCQYPDPSLDDLRAAWEPIFRMGNPWIQASNIVAVPGNRPPWTATGLHIAAGQEVSTFATGRVWRSKLLDLFLLPQFGLWFRCGVNGIVFNGTEHTNTFRATSENEELYVATQFPGQFGDKVGGRVQGNLEAYDGMEGEFNVVIVVWQPGVAVWDALEKMRRAYVAAAGETSRQEYSMLLREVNRLWKLPEQRSRMPTEWDFLWFMGVSDHFTQETDPKTGVASIRCSPHGKAGILQKDIVTTLHPDTTLEWDWSITALPSRLREDTTISHDYLSLAVEFENGRDLTYTWSWELPAGFGYWCPLSTWADREYHIVLRTGQEVLGKWLAESRNLYKDYECYIEPETMPQRIVRIWLIAGSRWQRHWGEMIVRNVRLKSQEAGMVQVV